MSMKKALDQTIRDLKRGVNKKVLKVPSVEQKVLDATSNEPWGPHGSLLADIAQATRNYHEYQMIMAVIWKRINDTGKNWRHVYKALTVLEYLVTNGSERVIDEIREHAYQISTLSDFQYIDSSGRDQGNNVRRKSQSLVLLVNDKEKIQEIREKAAGNRDKFRGNNSVGGMSRSSSGGFSDDRYEGRYSGKEDEHNGYGREKEQGFRDDERYGRHGDSYSREGDRYRKDSEHYGKDSYRDEDPKSQNVDDYQYASRSRSSERDRDRAYDDDDHHSSRGNSVKGQDHPSDGRPIERKFSEQNLAAPPSYEDAVGDSKTSTYSERDREIPVASPPQLSSPTADPVLQSAAPTVNTVSQSSLSSTDVVSPSQENAEHAVMSHLSMGSVGFDEFDPRGSFAATPSTSKIAEMDLLGSLSDVFSANPLAIMPVSSGTTDSVADVMEAAPNPTFTAATSTNNVSNQPFGDPFGDSPFKAVPSDKPQNFGSTSSLQLALTTTEATVHKVETSANIGFTDAFPTSYFNPADIPHSQTSENSQYFSQEPQPIFNSDILAGIFPPAEPLPTSQMPPANPTQSAFSNPTQSAFSPPTDFSSQPPTGGFMSQSESIMPSFSHMNVSSFQHSHHQSSLPYSLSSTALTQYVPQQAQSVTVGQQNNNFLVPQAGPPGMLLSARSAPPGSVSSFIPLQPPKEKFEPKSTVWADTLSKGLVDFNISGSKTNPLSDIGVDFESLNRKEKRMEKQPSTAPTTSNVSMGKAMGSGSGIGRSSGGGMRPPQMGPGMSMGMGMGGGPAQSASMGVGNYGSMNQQPMGIMGMGMNMGMPQGMPMQPPNGTNIGNYNPAMGRGGYPQQPYGGGYR